jgi:alkyl sulfatase BDS1-like metallo-beta-lactamase superfamily hydrolase
MDSPRFATLTKAMVARAPRRRLLGGLIGGSLGLLGRSSSGVRTLAQEATPAAESEPAPDLRTMWAKLRGLAATAATRAANAEVLEELPFTNTDDFDLAARGLIEATPDLVILDTDGGLVWDLRKYAFLAGDPPPTVNPSLWRNAQLNMHAGLFQVTDRIYQVRGFDLSNVTFVETDTGVIVIDPLAAVETAQAALALYYQHRPRNPVLAVIHTHSHLDHYGGVKGITTEDDVRAGTVRVFAPSGFLEHAISENVLAGNAMGRRASYMYGNVVLAGPAGQLDSGIGKTVSDGTRSLLAPSDTITQTGQEVTIDGVRLVFQLTPDTEAPAEMNVFFPDLRALCGAENATPTLHNLYTLRGAQVRDAKAWASYLTETVRLFGAETDVLFTQHFWPRWGQAEIIQFLNNQADMYKYLHDQTLRLANHGYTMVEIAEMIQLPASLRDQFPYQGYYGTVNHNVKAVYQKYLGWFDANPAHLHPLPPVEAAKRYVEFMGGGVQVLAKAWRAYQQGDYRWVAEVMNHLVFAEPANLAARSLQAAALEQLGFQAESGPWRNFYLVGAAELRRGVPRFLPAPTILSPEVATAMTPEMVFDYVGVRLNGPEAEGSALTFNVVLTDVNQTYALRLRNAALRYEAGVQDEAADATLTLTMAALTALVLGTATLEQQLANGDVTASGDPAKFGELLALLDTFPFWFDIVTP